MTQIVSLAEARARRPILSTESARATVIATYYGAPLLMGRTVKWWFWNVSALVLTSVGLCALMIGTALLAPEHAPR